MKRYIIYTFCFSLFASLANAQTLKWQKISEKSDSLEFSKLIIPEKYNIIKNTYLSEIKEWEIDNHISADSLFYLLSDWNKYQQPKKTGIICKYWVQINDKYKVPYFVYIPKNYNSKNKTALLVYYKGGWLNRDSYPSNFEKEIIKDNPTFKYLDEYNIIEVFPALKKDLAIYGNYGYLHLEKMVEQTKKLLNIDDNKVFLSGFSDGGKTVYNAASFIQTPFACFYPINSFPPSSPIYPNLVNRPIFSFSAEKDEITHYQSIKTKAEYVNKIGGNWTFRLLSDKTHFYYPYENEIIPIVFEHIKVTSRNALPNKISYDRSFNSDEEIDWLQISIDTKMPPTKYQFKDTIRTYYIGGEESTIEYGENMGQVRASYFDNTFTLTTSQVNAITIKVSPLMVDINKKVKIVANGKVVFNEKIIPSKSFMIENFLKFFDRSQVYVNQIKIKIAE